MRTPAPHGSSGKYARGCRCEVCRAANIQRMKDYRARIKDAPYERVPNHGVSGFKNFGCRCPTCVTAHRTKSKNEYAAKKRGRKAQAWVKSRPITT